MYNVFMISKVTQRRNISQYIYISVLGFELDDRYSIPGMSRDFHKTPMPRPALGPTHLTVQLVKGKKGKAKLSCNRPWRPIRL
jgi:hypothetical protein